MVILKRLKIGLLFIALLFLSCIQKDEKINHPVFGVDGAESVILIEGLSEALSLWVDNEIEKAVLVYVSPLNSLQKVPYRVIEKIKAKSYIKDMEYLQNVRGDLYGNNNFLYVASKTDLVQKMYWILPYEYFADNPLAGGKVKQFLKNTDSFKDTEINRMRMKKGCLTGRLYNVEVSICSPGSMPRAKVPVVMIIDAGFFPLYANTLKASKLIAMKNFFDEMSFREVRVRHVSISYGTEDGHTKPIHRFIGDELFEGTKTPGLLRSESSPDLWRYRDIAENMLARGEGSRVVEYLQKPLGKYADDLPLLFMNARALLIAGNYFNAFHELVDICSQDVHYCYGFVSFARILADRKKYSDAYTYYHKAIEALPDSPFVRNEYNSYLIQRGRGNEIKPEGQSLEKINRDESGS